MIRLDLTREQAEGILASGGGEIPGLRDAYAEAQKHNFVAPQELKFFLSDTNACGIVRSDEIVNAINKYARPHRADCKALTAPSDLSAMTCAVVQRQRNPELKHYLKTVRDKGIKVFYDLDDNLFDVPEEFTHVHELYSKQETKDDIISIMQACDGVTVATEPLGEAVRKRVGSDLPIIHVPNAIDLGTWYPSNPTVEDPVIIGWMASGTHTYDCSLMDQVMPLVVEAVGQRHIIVEIIGNVSPAAVDKWGIAYRQLPWTKYHDLPAIMSRWSMGIAPLQRNAFNDCKSNVKALQYWGLEKPLVASKSPVYEGAVKHGENGFLADTPLEWAEALITLAKDVDLRQEMGHNGYNTVVENYDLKDRAWDWIALGAGR